MRSASSPLRRPHRSLLTSTLSLALLAAVLTTPVTTASASAFGSADRAAKPARPTYHRINSNPDGKAGLEVWRGSCTTSGAAGDTDGFSFGYGDGQPNPYGPLSVAWRPDTTNSAMALRATTRSPGKVDRFDVQVYHPTPSVTGFVSVSFFPDRDVDEEWLGRSSILDSTEGWHPIDASSAVYQWTHLVNGAPDGAPATSSTLAAFNAEHGGPRAEASLGFAFGCDGGVTYVDGLRVGSTTRGWDVFDLVGKPSSISLKVSGSSKTCQVSAKKYPGTVKVRGRLKGLSRWGIWRVNSRGNLTSKVIGGKAKKGRYSGRVKVKRNAVLAAYAPHSPTTESAISKAFRVAAVPQIDFVDGQRTSVRGRALTVTGRVKPGRTRYTVLYSHWTGSRWTPLKAVQKGKTNRKGNFRVKAPTGALGYSRVSILTKPTRKVRGTLSRAAYTYRVTTEPQPASGPSGGSTQPESTSNPSEPPAPTPNTPGEGGDDLPGPIPEPGRMVVQERQGGFGSCGWKPHPSRPN